VNCLPRLALNCNPPDLSLPRSLDYRHEPPVPGFLSNMFGPWLVDSIDTGLVDMACGLYNCAPIVEILCVHKEGR
jgi:hypothetical protein